MTDKTQTFGARMRRRREELKIDLSAISERTKIGVPLLVGLERDDVSRWPGGIFRRAFVRAYAEAINLDPDVTVREFLEAHPDAVAAAPAAPVTNGQPPEERRPGGLRGLVSSLTGRGRAPAVEPPSVTPPPLDLEAPPSPPPAAAATRFVTAPDLTAVAQLCTRFSRVNTSEEVLPLLREAGRLLGARGLIVWVWDQGAALLRPALTDGYSRRVLANLPPVKRDDDNPTATAFRSASACVISGGSAAGALAVPLFTPSGCAGVLAIELRQGTEQTHLTRAIATIFAALLAQLIGDASAGLAQDSEARPDADVPAPRQADPPVPPDLGLVASRPLLAP